ncbi:SDR family NAD(P)-dependent oxidoreductase [Rhodococcus globerulus]|uniref:SDR family NAD(P)-dependent oxidoreductase n=1 Tax=Rhodococcus globerulus TaxID=33008 RepID=A0ABU4C5Q8_RHOGO|nr:SDR family NAD(P)-dependent oxidoreductase [Rhodococcus globerulus]MDV6271840.1 SDR family NAD(P)-dependent oxidoreductase [Rhodococcus globerulus]
MTTHKTWFITGAGRGFGRHWALAALERGDRVCLTARNSGALTEVVEQFPHSALALELDVTDREGVFEAVRQAHNHFGRLDVIVNNAGFGQMGAIEEVGIDSIRANFETNVFGTLSVIQAALPYLREQGSGHIVNVSSVAGVIAVPTAGIYEGAKFAVEGISEALAAEVAAFGIDVSIVEPSGYATDFLTPDSIGQAPTMPVYDQLREELASSLTPDALGDPTASAGAILALVDAEQPPLRLMLGNLLPVVKDVYAERIRTWEAWNHIALAAHAHPTTTPQQD